MIKEQHRLVLKRGELCRRITGNGEKLVQVVLTPSFREAGLGALPDSMGHPGKERTTRLIQERWYYWPQMTQDIAKWILRSKYDRCLLQKWSTTQRAPLLNIRTSQPVE